MRKSVSKNSFHEATIRDIHTLSQCLRNSGYLNRQELVDRSLLPPPPYLTRDTSGASLYCSSQALVTSGANAAV